LAEPSIERTTKQPSYVGKVPHGAGFDVLLPLVPILGSYVLSFHKERNAGL
jgi:hypothetical protein